MPQSLSKIYIHQIFHIKTTSPSIREEDQEQVQAYIGQILNNLGCMNLWIGGTHDHVHMLFLLSREMSVATCAEQVKRSSSFWIKSLSRRYQHFGWQGGYAALSVSQSVVPSTIEYIKNQREHHRYKTFEEEYVMFLKKYNIPYDERYIFAD